MDEAKYGLVMLIHAKLPGPRTALLSTLKQIIYFFRLFRFNFILRSDTSNQDGNNKHHQLCAPFHFYSIIPMLLLGKLKLCFLPFANDDIPVSLTLEPLVTS